MKIYIIIAIWLAVLGIYWKLVSVSKADQAQSVATLDILLDGPDLFIDFDVPAVQLMGFANAPVNSEEHKALVEAHRQLDSGLMIVPSASAVCTLTESWATVGHGYDDLCSVNAASALSGTQPLVNKVGKQNPLINLASNQNTKDISARWAWICEQPAKLGSLDIRLFDAFDQLKSIKISTDSAFKGVENSESEVLTRQSTALEL